MNVIGPVDGILDTPQPQIVKLEAFPFTANCKSVKPTLTVDEYWGLFQDEIKEPSFYKKRYNNIICSHMYPERIREIRRTLLTDMQRYISTQILLMKRRGDKTISQCALDTVMQYVTVVSRNLYEQIMSPDGYTTLELIYKSSQYTDIHD